MPAPIRTAVFPVAGLGTRFLPATKSLPKEMLPLIDKPIIQYGIEEVAASGISNVVLVTGRGKSAIEDYFDSAPELESWLERRGKLDQLKKLRELTNRVSLASVRQRDPLGLGHAVLMAKSLVGQQSFGVVLSDDVIDADPPALRQMMDVYERLEGPVIAVERVPEADVSSYGIVDIDPAEAAPRVHRIRDLVEKPARMEAPSNLAIIGRYILTPDIFPALEATSEDRSGEIQLTNGLRRLLASRPIYTCEIAGVRHDTGNKLGHLKATLYFGLRRSDLADQLREYLASLEVEDVGLKIED
jgi:UTP--glucose-1-phosphate uridylyltransferase